MNLLEFLQIKHTIENHNPEFSFRWRIERRAIDDTRNTYCIAIDDGNSAQHRIRFDKGEYSKDEIIYICEELARLLDIDCNVTFR